MFNKSMEATTSKAFMHIADILSHHGYSVGQEIGNGTYSKVRTAESLHGGNMYAVKIIDKTKVREDYLNKFMPRELGIVCKLKHKNVLRTFEIIQTGRFVIQVMQVAEKGDLLRLIQRTGCIPENQSRAIIRDVANGLSYMHSINVFHRDLKCENILICKDNTALISDFGFVRAFEHNEVTFTCRTFCGSTAYASPELLRGIPYEPRENDVWSLGCVVFTMLCGTMPFDDSNVTSMVRKQLSKTFAFPSRTDGKVSASCKRVVEHLLEPDVSKRWTLQQLLSSQWMEIF